MGARISIELQGLLSNPDVQVLLECEVIEALEPEDQETVVQRAKVNFVSNQKVHWFDVLSHDSKISLEADFNFFRNEEGHKWLMRCLFEASVPFTVIPG